jgi:hypothetical protein
MSWFQIRSADYQRGANLEQVSNRDYHPILRDAKRVSGRRREWIKVGVGCLLFALVYFVLTHVADFSSRQGLTVVALMVAGIGYANYRVHTMAEQIGNAAASKPSWRFLPYWVRVDPKWQQILTDFKLITTSHDWEKIKAEIYDAVPYGISYTVLQQTDDHQAQVIFRAERSGGFLSEVGFCDVVAPIEFEDVPKRLRLFMKSRGGEYDLGIIVPQKWWDRVKTGCSRPLQEETGESWYEAELTLARIPHAEFGWYLKPQCAAGSEYDKWRQEMTSERSAQRNSFGWKECKLSESWPERIEQTYFEVQHRPI